MKSIKILFLSLLTALSVSSCFIDIDDDGLNGSCIRGQGAIVTEELELNRVEAIDLKIAAVVYLRQGPEQKIEIEGQANIIDQIERDVRGGLWEIETDRCIRDMEELRIYITVPNVSSLRISGSGRIVSENELKVDDLQLTISGSGNIDLGVDADDIEASISGSGNLILEGVADEIRFRLSGSGDLRAYKLEARKGNIEISGSGDAEVFITEQLDVKISGSGDVAYLGRPSLNVSITGSGKVIDGN